MRAGGDLVDGGEEVRIAGREVGGRAAGAGGAGAAVVAPGVGDLRGERQLAAAGWHGVMLDTANKDAGGLRDWTDRDWLADFVHRARAAGLLVGLAGSLREDDVRPLAALGPDYLGFRGALCAETDREECLDPARVRVIRALLDRASN